MSFFSSGHMLSSISWPRNCAAIPKLNCRIWKPDPLDFIPLLLQILQAHLSFNPIKALKSST